MLLLENPPFEKMLITVCVTQNSHDEPFEKRIVKQYSIDLEISTYVFLFLFAFFFRFDISNQVNLIYTSKIHRNMCFFTYT